MDQFAGYKSELDSPGSNAEAVTPSDTVDLPHVSRTLYIGAAGGGNISIIPRDGEVAVPHLVYDGQELRLRVRRVMATGTDCTGIVCWY